MTPDWPSREIGLIQAERVNRLLGLNRLRYAVAIPLGMAVGYLADLAGASDMLTVVAFLAAQFIYGVLLGIWEYRQAKHGR